MFVLGTAQDVRTSTSVVYTQMSIPEYLAIVGTDFESFTLQRRRENHKAYKRLKSDIRDGALLPSITLAVKPESVTSILPVYQSFRDNSTNDLALSNMLNTPGSVDILDGLQRTYIMKDLQKEGHAFVDGQRILVEFWLEPDIHKLIYRIIVLNAGQKPMSMRHQLELLFMSLQDSITSRVDNVEIYRERDRTRRSRPRKFAFNFVVSAYQAFITSSAELQKDNVVANALMESSALDLSESELSQQFDAFAKTLSDYADLDEQSYRVYKLNASDQDSESDEVLEDEQSTATLPKNLMNWFSAENAMISFFAAVAQFSKSEEKRKRVQDAIVVLKDQLREAGPGSDPLGLDTFAKLRSGVSPRKVNVGVATRKLLTNGFKEFFREAGEVPLVDCWTAAAE